MHRRTFLGSLGAASALTIVPRRVLGGQGFVAPSDMILLAQVGCGTQAQRQVNTGMVTRPDLQFVAVVDPNKDTQNYVDWSQWGNRNRVRAVPRGPVLGCERHGHPGRARCRPADHGDVYKKQNRPGRGIRSYEDYREMLEKESDIQGIVNITPDHQHGCINIAALRKNKAAISHKPVASVLYEVRRTLQAARESAGAVAPARLQQPAGSAHAGGVDPGRRHRHGARGPQLDQPPVLAAGHAGVPRVGAARAGGLQLGAVAGARARSPLSSELHLRGVPRLVRVRHRLSGRHGALQPVAAVSHPEARRPGVRRGQTQQRGVRRREQRQPRRQGVARVPAQGEHRPLAPSRRRRIVRPSTRSGTTAG